MVCMYVKGVLLGKGRTKVRLEDQDSAPTQQSVKNHCIWGIWNSPIPTLFTKLRSLFCKLFSSVGSMVVSQQNKLQLGQEGKHPVQVKVWILAKD